MINNLQLKNILNSFETLDNIIHDENKIISFNNNKNTNSNKYNFIDNSDFWNDLNKNDYKDNIQLNNNNNNTNDEIFFDDIECIKNKYIEFNRFKNVYAIDKTRVKFSSYPDLYINANYINGIHSLYENKSHYIATQAPIKNTIYDFWLMIIENNVNIIVMLVNINEGYHKVMDYWTSFSFNYKNRPSINIKLLKEYKNDYFILREIEINYENKKKIIYQYNFISWPDQGIPKSIEEFYDFIDHVQKKEEKINYYNHNNGIDNHSPIVVHCSAGVGRTGCYIFIDTIMKYIYQEHGKNYLQNNKVFYPFDFIDPIKLVKFLRKQRMKMIQTKEQLLFCINFINIIFSH